MPAASKKLATTTAYILDTAAIPNLIFGWTALTLLTRAFNIREIEFVIPDTQITPAVQALTSTGYPQPCTVPSCPERRIDRDKHRTINGIQGLSPAPDPALQIDRYHSIPAAHFHLDDGGYLLSLHRKSELLWWIRDEDLALSTERGGLLAGGKHAHILLSDDRMLPAPWGGLYPVRTLNPHSFTEAVMLLVCRNVGHAERLDRMWGSILIVLRDADADADADGDGDGGSVAKRVRPLFRAAWEWFNQRPRNGDEMGLWKLLELREDLIGRGLLGPWPLPKLREFERG